MQHGDFTHIEIPADDPARAKSFFADVFGWTFADETPAFEGYHTFTTPVGQEGVGGAIGKRGETAPEQVRTYINVRSIEETLPMIGERGGRVVEDKSEVPGFGWYAVFVDTEGNEFGLWETMPRG